MTLKEVNKILSSGEGLCVEFKTAKESLPKNLFEPFPKNPHIAQIFTQIGRSEELGTGIKKVFKYSKHYSGSSEIEFLEKDIFITKIPLGEFLENTAENVTENVTENRLNLIIQLIKKSPKITTINLSKSLNVSRMTIHRDLEILKKTNKIKRLGPDNGGHWEIII